MTGGDTGLVRSGDADENVFAQWTLLAGAQAGGEVERRPGALRAATGLPFPHFNVLVVTAPPADPDELIGASRAWFARRRLPWCVRARGDAATAVDASVRRAGLRLEALETAMLLDPLGSPPTDGLGSPAPEPAAWRPSGEVGVTVEPVVDASTSERHVAVVASAYGVREDAIGSLLCPALLLGGHFRAFLGSVDGVPASVSALVTTGATAGVYNVGTVPARRRQGLATAVTWAALAAGRAEGCTSGVLQATSAGRRVYDRMGFRPVDTWHQWITPV